ncbi:MAG: hypothetical protein WD716_11260 [Fimbriimonadaceae bacterium]
MHNDTKPRRPRVSQFKSVQQFWAYHTNHPEEFSDMDATGIVQMAAKVRERTERLASQRRPSSPETTGDKRDFQREKTASMDGIGRELNGNSRAARTNPNNPEPTRANPNSERSGDPAERSEGSIAGEGSERSEPGQPEQPIGYKNPPAAPPKPVFQQIPQAQTPVNVKKKPYILNLKLARMDTWHR